MKNIALVTAAGAGIRFGSKLPKQFLPLNGKPLLYHTLKVFDSWEKIGKIYLILKEDQVLNFTGLIKPEKVFNHRITIVNGGSERGDSVYNGLKRISSDGYDDSHVFIHDGVRPFITERLLNELLDLSSAGKGVIPVLDVTDTLLLKKSGRVEYIDRQDFVTVQTPQVFILKDILSAYRKASESGYSGTDESSIALNYGLDIQFCQGSKDNIKITSEPDMKYGEYLIAAYRN